MVLPVMPIYKRLVVTLAIVALASVLVTFADRCDTRAQDETHGGFEIGLP
jgi:hypothetical protein